MTSVTSEDFDKHCTLAEGRFTSIEEKLGKILARLPAASGSDRSTRPKDSNFSTLQSQSGYDADYRSAGARGPGRQNLFPTATLQEINAEVRQLGDQVVKVELPADCMTDKAA